MKKGDLIFVYGTLRAGERADLHASQSHFNAQFIGEDRINGELFNLGSYPGVKLHEDADVLFTEAYPVVTGEVFKIRDDSLVVVLDSYEGYPYLYDRTQVTTEKGRRVWVYTYNAPCKSEDLIPSGDWKTRHSSAKEAA